MNTIRILLVEDSRILRDGITTMINEKKDIKERDIAVSSSPNITEDSIVKMRLDVPSMVLMDCAIAGQSTFEAAQQLRKTFPNIKIIVMGLMEGQIDILELVQAGVDGFILKNATPEDMMKTIYAVAKGEAVFPSAMTGLLFAQVVKHAILKGARNLKIAIRMTSREKEVISLITDGMSNKEIATNLNIATFTVKSHVHNIMEKLSLHSRLQIANHSRFEMSL